MSALLSLVLVVSGAAALCVFAALWKAYCVTFGSIWDSMNRPPYAVADLAVVTWMVCAPVGVAFTSVRAVVALVSRRRVPLWVIVAWLVGLPALLAATAFGLLVAVASGGPAR
jgi:hypothetical protein